MKCQSDTANMIIYPYRELLTYLSSTAETTCSLTEEHTRDICIEVNSYNTELNPGNKMVREGENPKEPLLVAMKTFEKTTRTPTDYLKEQKKFADENCSLLKSLFEYSKTSGTYFESEKFPNEIYVDQMDEEQIWQQLEMQNEFFWEKCMAETCRLLSLNEKKMLLKVNYPGSLEREDSPAEGNTEIESDNESDVNQDSDNKSYQSSARVEDEETYDDDDDDDDDGDEDEEDDVTKGSVTENETDKQHSENFKNASSNMDDQFFKLNEMETFLDNEDKKELDRLNGKRIQNTNDEDLCDEIDYFDSLSENENSDAETENSNNAKSVMFADFFDTEDQTLVSAEQWRQQKRVERETKNRRKDQQMKEDLGIDVSEEDNDDIIDDEDVDSENRDDSAEKSEYDLRQQRLKNRIEELEEKALANKPWQLKGEITSSTRPKNSLLEEVLEFDSVVRPPPLITEETTMCLEDIIKRRIKSKAWDDVERKIKPINDHQDFRKKLVLQQEKSKDSLAQIYEKEYLEKVHKLNNVVDSSNSDEAPEHVEIRQAMKDLFIKLDALSNFHFTSKPVAPEAKIMTNIPAIEMEEVAPVSVSDATLLAPEEVRARPVGDDIGKTERSSSDKKRERRKKKLKQKLVKQQNDKRIEEKEKFGIKVTSKEKQQQIMNQVTKSRNVIKSKNTTNDENKALKSSKSFFTQLQDNISTVKSKSVGKKKSATNLIKQESNAKRFKL